jgi:hypothetical protein
MIGVHGEPSGRVANALRNRATHAGATDEAMRDLGRARSGVVDDRRRSRLERLDSLSLPFLQPAATAQSDVRFQTEPLPPAEGRDKSPFLISL